jgi:TRAP-type C4-dicarboxylate transport system substrate-binding protein
MFKRFGSTPMPILGSEVYAALERGILDVIGTYCFVTAVKQRLLETAPYVIEMGAGAHAPTPITINMDLWRSLPTHLKDIFMKTVDEIFEWKFVDLNVKLMEESVDEAMQMKAKFSTWSDVDIGKAKKIVQPAQINDWIEKVCPPNVNGREFQEKIDELIAKYEPHGKLKTPWEIYKKKYA